MSPFQRGNSKTLRLLLISGRTQEAERLRSLFSAGGLGNAHVMDAPTLDDAIDFLEKTSMDAVLLDLTQLMGHELEALDTLLKVATNCPVVVLTDENHEDLAVELLRHGAQEHLVEGQFDGRMLWRILSHAVERKHLELAHQESERRYHLLTENMLDVIWSMDMGFRFTYVSPSVLQLRGYTVDEVMHQSITDVLPPASLMAALKSLTEHLAKTKSSETSQHTSWTVELEQNHKNGNQVWTDTKLTLIRDAHGKPCGVMGVSREISKRKAAEERSYLAEEKYRMVFENSAAAITVTDEEERIISWNKYAETLLGMSYNELYLKPVRELYPAEEWGRMQSLEIRKQGMLHHFETQVLRKDASKLDVDVSVTVLKTADGGKTGSIGIITDITERKNKDRQLRLAEEKYRTVFDNSAVAITVTDAEERIISWNRLAEELLGLSGDELKNRPVQSLYTPEEWQRLQSMDLRKKGMIQNVETQIVKKDGTALDVDICITVLKTADGGKSGSIGIIQDITERKEAERKLRVAEEKYRTIFDNSPVAITIADARGMIVSWNRFSEELLGRSYDKLQGAAVQTLYPADEWEKIHSLNIIQKGTAHFETKIVKGNGDLMDVKTSVSVITDEQGRVTGSIGIIRDITERNRMMAELKQAKVQAEKANQTKSEFLSNMSHEIRTPMNGIMGMVDLLLETVLNQEQQEYAQYVKSSADSLLTLINDILDFSKVEAGKLQIESIPFDLWSSVEEVAALLAPRAQERGLELIVRFSPDTPRRMIGDPGRLRQIVTNLVGNAIKFTHKGYVLINVDAKALGDGRCEFKVSVEDTGIGIPKDKIEYVFEKFTQADASTTRRYGGTGLGLAICKQLSQLMGGTIGAESHQGKGSTFWFTVVFALDHKAVAPLPAADLAGIRVLIIDDIDLNRRIFLEQVAQWGMPAGAVASGEEGLAALHKAHALGDPYQIAILDYQLPGMDGFMLTKAIKADPVLKDTVLLMLTSAGERGDAKKMEEAGVSGYLVKPARQDQLRETLSAVWGAKKKNLTTKLVTRHTLREEKVRERESKFPAEMVQARVLLAEDNEVSQKVARKMMERIGCQVDTAMSGREVLDKLETHDYDLIFMDCQMPEMDGYETTREIRRRTWKAGKTPIIALTAHAMDGDREKCLKAGMDDYISKPVKSEDLKHVIQQWSRPVARPVEAEPRQHSSTEAARRPPQAAGSNTPVIDEKVINALREYSEPGDNSFIEELFDTFLKTSELHFSEIETALLQRQPNAMMKAAHTLKGGCRNLGGRRMGDLCEKMETLGRENSLKGAADLFGQIKHEFQLFAREYESKWRTKKSA